MGQCSIDGREALVWAGMMVVNTVGARDEL
jgi:hypothetical protein